MDSFYDLWDKVKEKIRDKTSETVYSVWFSNLEFQGCVDDTVTLSVESFRAGIINDKFLPLLTDAFQEVLGFNVKVVINPDEIPEEKPVETLGKTNEYTFDNFVVGNSNKFAHAAALAVAQNPGKAYNPLFIHGNSGLGKTHLLNAICCEIRRNNPDAYIVYTRSEDFTNELIDYLQNKKDTSVFHNKYRNADVLLVDDIQFIAGKDSTQLEFFHTFDVLIKANSQIVLTSDRPPREIATLEERLRTRFESGLLADIQPPDIETRMAIIKRKANALNLSLSDDVILFIAEKIKSNIRQLEGAVKNMQAQIQLHGAPANIATAQLAIRDIFSEGLPTPATVEKIIREVARTYNVDPTDITGKKRDAKISSARQIAMYVVSDITQLSYKAIGQEFGGKDHTTVMYAVKKVQEEKITNFALKNTIADIIKNVKED